MNLRPLVWFILFLIQSGVDVAAQNTLHRRLYLSVRGNDKAAGSRNHPWRSIARLNQEKLKAGDEVLLESGNTFMGPLLLDSLDSGLLGNPVIIRATGKMAAHISGGDSGAITIRGAHNLVFKNLQCSGNGRKTGNRENGIAVVFSSFISLNQIEVSGFQKAGVMIYSSDSITIRKTYAHDNGFAGISVDGEYQQRNSRRIHIVDCLSVNNPGDPTNLYNHSGNGIIVGNCRNVCIEYCVATGNGWDMPRTGNGPVGIWGYEADSLVIQHCIAYRNRTSKGGGDGGGFDLDGGVTHSMIQYCLSYENEGSGFGIFQYAGASPWHHNTFRFNISINDGAVSPAGAAIFIWNSSMDTTQFRDCFIYNNTIYNQKAAAISYEPLSANAGFLFVNNVFIGKDDLIIGKETNSTYLGNCWYSLEKGFRVGRDTLFREWAKKYGKEQWNGKLMGANLLPRFRLPRSPWPVEPRRLATWFNMSIFGPLQVACLDFPHILKQDIPMYDFSGKPVSNCFTGAANY